MPTDGNGALAIPAAPTWSVSALFNGGLASSGAVGAAGGGAGADWEEEVGVDAAEGGPSTLEATPAEVTTADVVRLGKLAHLPVSDVDAEAYTLVSLLLSTPFLGGGMVEEHAHSCNSATPLGLMPTSNWLLISCSPPTA
jgi:hypothetical protein